jgi:hypothetical protein
VATADHRTADGSVWDGVVVESSGECAVAVVVVGVGGEWRERGTDVVRAPPADTQSGRVCMSDEVLEQVAAGAGG